MFNIIAQWHPLRLAEDFATLHNLSGGRRSSASARHRAARDPVAFWQPGVDRVVRQPRHGRGRSHQCGSPTSRSKGDQARVRERDVLVQERKYFEFPPRASPIGEVRRDADVDPRPKYPYEIWQAITSPPTLERAPTLNHGGVFWNQNHKFIKRFFDRYGEVWPSRTTAPSSVGRKRLLVLNVRVEDTYEEALDSARPGHDEFGSFPRSRTAGVVVRR